MNTHTIRRHVEALTLRQQITKEDRRFLTSHRPRIFVTGPCPPVPLNPQLQLGEKRMMSQNPATIDRIRRK
jgi:hypothetical protein